MTLHLECVCGRMWMDRDRPASSSHMFFGQPCPFCGALLRVVHGPALPLYPHEWAAGR